MKEQQDLDQKKDRITITVRKDLLGRIDDFIDGETIRNRSHAIEYILSQHLGLGIQRAVILASFQPLQSAHALTHVRNRSIISYIIDMLKEHGIRNVILVVSSDGRELEEYLGDGTQWGLHLEYVRDKNPMGTAHALSLAAPLLHHTFLVIFSDVLGQLNIADFLEHHQQTDAVATLALTYKKSQAEYGVARMDGNMIVEFTEKPGVEGEYGLVNAGMYLMEPSIFDHIEKDTKSLEYEVFPRLAKNRKLSGYPFHGKWYDISNPAERKRAEREW